MKIVFNTCFFIFLSLQLLGITCLKSNFFSQSHSFSSTFIQVENYMDAYNKMKLSTKQIDKLRNFRMENPGKLDSVYTYYDTKKIKMEFSIKEDNNSKLPILAEAHYISSRFKEGWDKLYIKTNAVANPFIQCWAAGYLEGVLSYEEIYAYYNNIHVFFQKDESQVEKIMLFYKRINQNLDSKLNINYFKTLNKHEYEKWLHYFCLRSQLEGLSTGYTTMIEGGSEEDKKKKLSLLDFYFINSEGNFDDIKNFLRMNQSDIKNENPDNFNTEANLKKIYNTDNIEYIWGHLTSRGHCSAIAKLVIDQNGKYDIFAGHDTWSSYSELTRTLKYYEFAFEESKVVGMKKKSINFSSYPGVLFSGDDFYLLDNKILLMQTTLSAVNKLIYKNIISEKTYIPEFMRIMTTNFMSDSAVEWYENYKNYKDHMYITQWIIIDYKVLNELNDGGKVKEDLIYLVEEVPQSIKGTDITKTFMQNTFIGSFNLPYYKEHAKTLGISWIRTQLSIKEKNSLLNPRMTILKHFQNSIGSFKDFENLIKYNGFKDKLHTFPKDPSFFDPTVGISARGDVISNKKYAFYGGGIDYKIVNANLVKKMMIKAHCGPVNNKVMEPFTFPKVSNEKKYQKGIPKTWNFSPIHFGREDAKKLFNYDIYKTTLNHKKS